MHHIKAAFILILLLACRAPAQPSDLAPVLLKDVAKIAAPGVPGSVVAYGPFAQPIVLGRVGKNLFAPVVVAGTTGEAAPGAPPGRIVAFGHSGYLSKDVVEKADTGALLCNSIRWAAGDAEPGRPIAVGVIGSDLAPYLNQRQFQAKPFATSQLEEAIAGTRVLVIAASDWTDAQVDRLRAFVSGGRGLVVAQTGWGWQQLNGGKDVQLNPINRALSPYGMQFTDGTVEKTAGDQFATDPPPPEFAHAGRAIDALVRESKAELSLTDAARAQAVESATLTIRNLPEADTLIRPQLTALLHSPISKLPSKDSPLRTRDGLSRVLVAMQTDDLKRLPPDRVTAHPAAADFPGAVATDAKAVERSFLIDPAVPGWHSLGLYAPAGKVVTLSFTGVADEALAKAKLNIRIGAHTDTIWHHDRWERMPEISRQFAVSGGTTTVASAFGGLLYVELPNKCPLKPLSVAVTGAVEAPLFVLGQTSVQDWRDRLRCAPGPWAEIATSKVIVTVPSSEIRNLDDPTPVAEFWDRVLDAAADLATIPRERPRPERYVADVQISAGYMHSGYPIMTHLDAAPAMVSIEKLKAGQWGLFHELGHNHQYGMWTFDGTGEVTCNLFSMYILEEVCGLPKEQGHGAVADRAKRMQKYFAQPPTFDRWKADPFTALVMYAQMREAFGWEAYKKVFAEYRALPRELRPRSEEQKRDQWMVRMSRTVGHDLGPFFQAWGVPTSEDARASIRDLPAWMPPEMPGSGGGAPPAGP